MHNPILCETCYTQVCHSYWNDGTCQYKQPRVIHDVDTIVFLVSAVYTCAGGHKLVASDSRIVDKLPAKTSVPYLLLHKTGFTRRFVNLVDSLCRTGMNFYSLEAAISHARWQHFEEDKEIYSDINRKATENSNTIVEFPSFKDTAAKYLPSDDLLRECFISNFITSEDSYKRYIQSMNTGSSLSFDHTFKVAANIGYLRSDNKWVAQYDSVFLAMNKVGEIVSWKFSKGNSFHEIEPLLKCLRARARLQGNPIQCTYVDNCCHWRNQLKGVFGEDCVVKLDLFHAVQRILRKVSKRHPFHGTFCSELRVVFRQHGDYGSTRTKATPQPTQMLNNLDKLKNKWRKIIFEGVPVLSNEALDEFDRLSAHIRKGCLSDIPVEGGTNRNEAFHRYINRFFHKSRMGILLGYALMMTIICDFNSRSKADKPTHKKLLKPISALMSDLGHDMSVEAMEEVGLYGIAPNKDHTWEHDDTQEDMLDAEEVSQILTTSISQFKMLVSIKQYSKTGTYLWKYIPYMQMLPAALFGKIGCLDYVVTEQQEAEKQEHLVRLKAILLSWRFHHSPVDEDGNCFFSAIALGLLQNAAYIISGLGIQMDSQITVLVAKLREVIVAEWLGPNRYDYEEFLTTDICYESEANHFLTDGYYNSELGNSMPLAMANALKISIVVFSSQEGSPVYYVSSKYTTQCVLYLAYTSYQGGHYDHCVPMSDIPLPQPQSRCRCGVNARESDKETYVACNHGDRQSSCKCLAANKPCTDACKCKGCSNPAGTRVQKLGKRKRTPHPMQNVAISNQSFVMQREVAAHGSWSEFETIVFIHCVKHVEMNFMDSTITVIYNTVVKYMSAAYCTLHLPEHALLRNKTTTQCAGKLLHFEQEKEMFNQYSTAIND